jgi:glyoxylase-like metal-dependent hydrolase (beta-lactamase superfamily II)
MKEAVLYFSCILCLSTCKKDETRNNDTSEEEEYVVIEIESDWFEVSYVESKTYVIEEPISSEGNVSYLILGDNRAIMFDTGTGENPPVDGSKIEHIIDQLSPLPVTLLLSHFHYDHNQNIGEFDWVAFPDIPLLQSLVGADSLYDFTNDDLIVGNYPSQVLVNEWLSINTDIDLGGRVIQLVNVTGHSAESIAIIDKTNKLAFMGDFLYNGELFIFDPSDLEAYEESADHLISVLDSDYRLFGAHGSPEVSFEKLQRLKDFLVCIDNGTCKGVNTFIFGFPIVQYSYEGMIIDIFL